MLKMKTKKRREQKGHVFTSVHAHIYTHTYVHAKVAPGKQSSNIIYPAFIHTCVHAKVAPGKQASKEDGLHSGLFEVSPLG
jgi:hypothetical protein